MIALRNRFETDLDPVVKARIVNPVLQSDQTVESMYATHHPRFRFASDWFVSKRDECESRFPEEDRLDAFNARVREAYAEGRASIWTRFTTALAMNKASGLGGTENTVAERLDMDRSAVNVALNHGDLGSLPLIDLMSNPFVLYHIFINNLNLRSLMGQNGFIEAAKCAAALKGVDSQAISHMAFLPYNLLCQDIEIRSDDDWKRPLNRSQIAAIVSSVTDPAAKLLPDWFSKKNHKAARQTLGKLADIDFAANYIQSLEIEWIEIYVHTFATVEGIGCDDLWEHD